MDLILNQMACTFLSFAMRVQSVFSCKIILILLPFLKMSKKGTFPKNLLMIYSEIRFLNIEPDSKWHLQNYLTQIFEESDANSSALGDFFGAKSTFFRRIL